MEREKLRRILQQERPDLVEVPVDPPKVTNIAADVNDREASEATWKSKLGRRSPKPDLSKGLSSDEINDAFAPRELGSNLSRGTADAPAAAAGDEGPGIVRAAKKHPKDMGYAGDAADADKGQGPGVKDFIVDDKRGIIGSQG